MPTNRLVSADYSLFSQILLSLISTRIQTVPDFSPHNVSGPPMVDQHHAVIGGACHLIAISWPTKYTIKLYSSIRDDEMLKRHSGTSVQWWETTNSASLPGLTLSLSHHCFHQVAILAVELQQSIQEVLNAMLLIAL